MAFNRINFTSIPVSDQDRALNFYTTKMLFTLVIDAAYETDWRWIFLSVGNAETRLQFARRAETDANDVPALTLTCDDVDVECARLADAGVTIINAPDDAPWATESRWAMIKDTENNLILIESIKKEA